MRSSSSSAPQQQRAAVCARAARCSRRNNQFRGFGFCSAPFLFGQDDDSVKTDDPAKEDARKKTYDGATLEDKFDKSALPKVMQVKKFGFSGRTKYTHLVDQDTTNFESAWAGADDLRDKYFSKSAGMKMNGDLNNAGKKRRRD